MSYGIYIVDRRFKSTEDSVKELAQVGGRSVYIGALSLGLQGSCHRLLYTFIIVFSQPSFFYDRGFCEYTYWKVIVSFGFNFKKNI